MLESGTPVAARWRVGKRILLLVILAAVVGTATIFALRGPTEEAASRLIVGTWRAVDPANSTLHLRKAGVVTEEVSFRDDGTVTYRIEGAASQPAASTTRPQAEVSASKTVIWGWKIEHDRLYLRDLGESSGREWMPSLPLTISKDTFSVKRKTHDEKVFARVG